MKKKMLWIVFILVLVSNIVYYSNPYLKSLKVVAFHSAGLEQRIENGEGIPTIIEISNFNIWEGHHYMVEFTITGLTTQYSGCFYSPDDVPLAFQNSDVDLIIDGKNRWKWFAEGDNKGIIRKIKDKWYYYEASF